MRYLLARTGPFALGSRVVHIDGSAGTVRYAGEVSSPLLEAGVRHVGERPRGAPASWCARMRRWVRVA